MSDFVVLEYVITVVSGISDVTAATVVAGDDAAVIDAMGDRFAWCAVAVICEPTVVVVTYAVEPVGYTLLYAAVFFWFRRVYGQLQSGIYMMLWIIELSLVIL